MGGVNSIGAVCTCGGRVTEVHSVHVCGEGAYGLWSICSRSSSSMQRWMRASSTADTLPVDPPNSDRLSLRRWCVGDLTACSGGREGGACEVGGHVIHDKVGGQWANGSGVIRYEEQRAGA